MSSSNSPCAACKFLRRKCTQECDFAPYFPPDNPQRFACVHRVFGASNVAKLLKELSPAHREDAVKSLAYEAEARLRDPVFGCVGLISTLQQKLRQLQQDLQNAKKEIATYISPEAMQYHMENPGAIFMNQHGNHLTIIPNHHNFPPQTVMANGGQLVFRDTQSQQHEQEILEAQQLVTAQQLRGFEQQQLMRFESVGGNSGFGQQMGVAVHGHHHAGVTPSLTLGTFGSGNGNGYQIQQEGEGVQQQQSHVSLQHHHVEPQLMLSQQDSSHQPPHQQQSETVDGRSVDPSC